MSKRTVVALLAVILIVGAGLRLYHLASVPVDLVADELEFYNSPHSIATTGHDVDGSLQVFFASKTGRNPPIYGVAAYLSTLVLGKNAFALRFPAALFGIVTILLVYLIALEITRRRDAALVAGLVAAVSPVLVHFSRIAWQPACELPFLLAGLYLLLRARTLDFDNVCGGGLLLGLTCYTYMAGWFYAAALGVAAVLVHGRQLRNARAAGNVVCGVLVWLAIALPALLEWFANPDVVGRTQRIATFATGVNAATLHAFLSNYVAHFRWSYLVSTGEPQSGVTWRYLNGFGAFAPWVLVVAAAGALSFSIRPRGMLAFTYLWLLIYPMGGSLTNEGAPNAPRTLAGDPVFCIFAGVGFIVIVNVLSRVRYRNWNESAQGAAAILIAGLAAGGTYRFADYYFTRYPHSAPNAWSSGSSATFARIIAESKNYDRVCFSIYPGWYDIATYVRFYLDGVQITPYESANDPACYERGTLLVADNDHPITRPGFRPIAVIRDANGDRFAVIQSRPR